MSIYLGPVAEDLSVASVRDEFVWELCHPRVQVVHDHMHDGRGMAAHGGVVAEGVRPAKSS